jgi:sugar O-acyltransferase (sialic acid O-acetyltransferase NeuD family)
MGVVIIGCGVTAEAVLAMVERDNAWDVVGFATDRAHMHEAVWHGRPVCALDELETFFPPTQHFAFVAIGYHQCNRIRFDRMQDLYGRGYQLASYRSPWAMCTPEVAIAANVFLADGAQIQPHARLESGVFVWHGALVGHHSLVRAGSWLTGGCHIGGQADIGERCFLGLGATVGHAVTIGDDCLLGAGSLTTHDVSARTVLAVPDTEPHRLQTEQFLRLTGFV